MSLVGICKSGDVNGRSFIWCPTMEKVWGKAQGQEAELHDWRCGVDWRGRKVASGRFEGTEDSQDRLTRKKRSPPAPRCRDRVTVQAHSGTITNGRQLQRVFTGHCRESVSTLSVELLAGDGGEKGPEHALRIGCNASTDRM